MKKFLEILLVLVILGCGYYTGCMLSDTLATQVVTIVLMTMSLVLWVLICWEK